MATTHDVHHEIDRNRYNAAFHELGLEWYWDAATYSDLRTRGAATNLVHAFVESHVPHLLRAYDADFLVAAVESKRSSVGVSLHS